MTIEEAIKHAEEVAEKQEKMAKEWHENQVRKCDLFPFAVMDYTHENECKECAEEHRQLAELLKELKQLRDKTRWIPVSEKLPKDLEEVNITYINHVPEPCYNDIKDKPFTATGVYFNGQWYWWSAICTDILAVYGNYSDNLIDDDIEIIAWQPLPDPYE